MPTDKPQSRRLRIAVVAAATLLLLAQWVTTALLVHRAREAAMNAGQDTVQRIVRSTEASLNRSLVSVDATLAGLPAILSPLATDGRLDVPLVNRVLRELNNQNFVLRDILLVQADGTPLATGLAISRRRPLPPQLTGTFFESGSRGGGVLIGGPYRNPATGEWALFLARRLTLPGMGPITAVAEIPLPVIGALLGANGETAGLRITVERDDGTLMASMPHDETMIGRKLVPPATSRQGGANATAFEASSRFDGRAVIAAVRPTLYPSLAIATSMPLENVLAGWERERTRAYLISAGFAVLVIVIAATLMVALRQREKVELERIRWRGMLENAIDSMTDGFVMWDSEDRLVACNARYKDFYRVSAPFIKPGAHFEDIMREGFKRGQYPQAGDDVEAFLAEMRLWHRGDNPPMERLLPDGRWVLITERSTPDGGTVGIRTDITEIRRTIEDLAAARDAAAAAGEAKSQFLARMSHELRTPLNSILGFAQVLLNDPRIVTDQREQLQTLHDAARHLLDLVNGLLDLSKIAAGRLEIRPAPVELRPLLERCSILLGPEVVRKNLRFTLDIHPDVPSAVLVDSMRLRQLLLNLLSNAVKFTPAQGSVWLRAHPLPGGQGIRLAVQDTGPGVPPEQRHLLFQDFMQLSPPEHENTGGTGLGLAIASQLAKLMGGSIGYDSPEEGGALFWVELPLPEAEMPWPGLLPPESGTSPPALLSVPPRDCRRKVLVADDVAANRLVARAMLTGAGHHVVLVEDGAAALAAVQAEDFDLVLMDLQMPVMDGLEATRRIRALPPPRNAVPIIAVTASVLPEQVEACRAAGMNAHLAKPIDRESLLALMVSHGRPHPSATMARETEQPPLLDPAVRASLGRDLGPAATPVLAEFVVELRRGAETFEAFSSHGDQAQLRTALHRLIGVSRTLGAARLVRALEGVTQAVQERRDPAGALAEALLALQETLPAVVAWLESPTSEAPGLEGPGPHR